MKQFNQQCSEYLDLYEEGWKDKAKALGVAGLLAISPQVNAATHHRQPAAAPIVNTTGSTNVIARYIEKHEGRKPEAYLDSKQNKTIGIGHFLTNTEQDRRIFTRIFGSNVNYNAVYNKKQQLTNDQIEMLFEFDINSRIPIAKKLLPKYETYPVKVQAAILDGIFRGDLPKSKKTLALMNQGDWVEAADEYINSAEYRESKKKKTGVYKRMDDNSAVFRQYGNQSTK